VPTYNAMTGPLQMTGHLANYLLLRRGMLTAVPVHAMAYVRSAPELPQPDIKLQLGPLCTDPKTKKPHQRSGVSVFTNVSPPHSRGEIRLRSADPQEKPVIDHRIYGDERDVTAMIAGLK